MILAGLDIATTTGLAVLRGPACLHWEAFRAKGEADAAIFHAFRGWLRPTLIAHNVEAVGIEEPLRTDLKRKRKDLGQAEAFAGPAIMDAASSMKTYLRLYGFFGHAIEICEALGLPFHVANQSTWRKAFGTNGAGDKKALAKAQCERLGWHIKSQDAAEGAGVAFWLQGQLNIARAGELPVRAPA